MPLPRPPQLLSRILVLLAGTALGLALLVFLLRSVNLGQLGNSFSHVDYSLLLLAVPFFLANLLLKLPRWAILYGRDAPDWDTLFGAMNVGYAINALLPARLGEIVRAYWIRDRAGISMVKSFSTIALERVTDGVTLILLLLVVAPTVALPSTLLAPALTIGVLFVGALVVMVMLALAGDEHVLMRLLRSVEASRLAPVGRAIRQGLAGLQVLRDRRSLLLLLLYTAIIWASNIVLVWLVVRAFHLSIPITAAIVLTSVLNLGMAVPSSPGYIGWYEYLMVQTLGLYGIHYTPALAAAFAFHAIAFMPVTFIGLFYIARTGLETTTQIVRMSARRAVEQPSPSQLQQ